MSSNDDSDVPLANTSLTKRTKSGQLSQLPQSRRPEGILNPLVCVFVENIDRIVIGAPPLQRRAPSPVVILPSPKTVRRKARSEEEDLADLGLAFKRQRQSGMPNSLLPIPTDSERQLPPLVWRRRLCVQATPRQELGETHPMTKLMDRQRLNLISLIAMVARAKTLITTVILSNLSMARPFTSTFTGVYNKQRVRHAPATEGYSSESSSDLNEDETRHEDTLSTGESVPPTLQFAMKSNLSITR